MDINRAMAWMAERSARLTFYDDRGHLRVDIRHTEGDGAIYQLSTLVRDGKESRDVALVVTKLNDIERIRIREHTRKNSHDAWRP